MQPTNTTRTDEFAPMWVGWNYGWPDWTWGGLPATAFTTQYSGRVMANLQSSDGKQGGSTVDAVFPAA